MYSKYILQGVFLFLTCLFSLNKIYSQSATATIKGKVIDQQSQGIMDVSIHLLDTKMQAYSDINGQYEIDRIPPGSYVIKASAVGYESFEEQINLDEGDVFHLNLTIHENTNLELVTIVADGNPFTDKRSSYVARMPLKPLENPQTYDVIPKELFKEQMAMTFGEALLYISGASVPQTGSKGKEGIALRGFGLKTRTKDGMSNFSKTAIDPSNIEKIEVIKGPSATLFGANLTSYGGLTNIITKKPYKTFGASLSYNYRGADNKHRTEVDINTPLNHDETLMFRLNAAGETGDQWQDAGFKKSLFVAPAVTWEINKKIVFDVNAEIYELKSSPDYYLRVDKSDYHDVRDIPIDWKKSFINDDVTYRASQYNLSAKLHAELNDEWTSDTKVALNNNPINGDLNTLYLLSDNENLYHETKRNDQRHEAQEIQQNFNYQKEINDRWENKLLVGLDYYHYKSREEAQTVNFDTINFVSPAKNYRAGYHKENIDEHIVNGNFKEKNKSSATTNYAAYLSNVISLDKQWFLMASLRVDYFKNEGDIDLIKNTTSNEFSQTAFSPKFGLVYQPIKDKVSLFGNYMNSFENVNGVDKNGKTFKPEHANQWEGGVKVSLLDKHLVGTVSYYHIKVEDMLRPDMTDDDFNIQDGTRLSSGIDLNLSYNPVAGLNLQTAYSYNYSKFEKAEDGLQGLRPYDAGPKNTASLWISYKVLKGNIKGLGFAAGGFYGSSLKAVKSTYDFYMPEYTILNASVFYEQPQYRIGFKLDNLNNEDYWDYRLRKHNPRTLALNLTVKI